MEKRSDSLPEKTSPSQTSLFSPRGRPISQILRNSLKLSKSNVDDETETEIHSLESTYFSSPTWCRVCETFIWGITKSQQDGLKCTICNVSIHSRCLMYVGSCVKPTLSLDQAVVAEPFESSSPGQCASYLYIKTMGNSKKWVQLYNGNLHYYNNKGDTQKLEEIHLLNINEVVSIEPGVLRSLCGFEIVFPGILNDNLIFYCDTVENREYWLHHLLLVIKIKKQSIEEKITQYLWSDLLPYNKNEETEKEILTERRPERKSETETTKERIREKEKEGVVNKERERVMEKDKEREKEKEGIVNKEREKEKEGIVNKERERVMEKDKEREMEREKEEKEKVNKKEMDKEKEKEKGWDSDKEIAKKQKNEIEDTQRGVIQLGDTQLGDIQRDIKQGDILGDIQQRDIQLGDIKQGDIKQGDIQQGDIQQGDIQQGYIPLGDIQQRDIQQGHIPLGDIQQRDIQQGDIQQGDSQNQQKSPTQEKLEKSNSKDLNKNKKGRRKGGKKSTKGRKHPSSHKVQHTYTKLEEVIILFHKIVNKNITTEDLKFLDDDVLIEYLPIFLQLPQLMDGLIIRMKNIKIQQAAYWNYKAQLKMANCYLSNQGWLGDTTKLERTWKFFSDLVSNFPLKEGTQYTNLDLYDPLWKAGTIKEISVLKIFRSAHSPCLLQLTYDDPLIPPCRVVFKDDDVRPDMMASIIFGVCNTLWRSSGLLSKPELVHFKVVPGGPSFGFLEFMENSVSLRDYDASIITKFSIPDMERFLSTTSAGFIGGFLFGIRDRHEDNLMIAKMTDFFQLDFGFMFNNKTRGIDACRFAISRRIKNAIESRDNKFSWWQNFKDRAAACFMVLRRNSQTIVQLCQLLFNDMFPGSQIETEILRSFYLDRSEDEAVSHVQELIELGVTSVKRLVKNVTHEIYQKM